MPITLLRESKRGTVAAVATQLIRRLKHGDENFEASLSHTGRACLKTNFFRMPGLSSSAGRALS